MKQTAYQILSDDSFNYLIELQTHHRAFVRAMCRAWLREGDLGIYKTIREIRGWIPTLQQFKPKATEIGTALRAGVIFTFVLEEVKNYLNDYSVKRPVSRS